MALRYLLDTNIVSNLVRNPHGAAAQRLLSNGAETAAIGVVVAGEIRFGIAKGVSTRLADRLTRILEHLEVLPLEAPVDQHYADIRHALERAGTPIGPNDLWIAAQARTRALVLVTDNIREFSRVPDLRLENWLN